KMIYEQTIGFITDQLAIDGPGNLWLATRSGHLMVFAIHPDQPTGYLQLLKDFSKELPFSSPRSITIDTGNNIWIGTRYDGIFKLKITDLKIQSVLQFSTSNGLTDNFVYTLGSDRNNNIWAGTQSGLDKIFLKDGDYIISNVSRNNNFFQSIRKIVSDDNNTVWALSNEGTILKISPYNKQLPSPPPVLISLLKVNDKLYTDPVSTFPYQQNNFLFSVASPSFTD